MAGMTGPDPAAERPLSTDEEALLARSARLLASEDPEAFIDVSARVRSTVRATTRRSRPVHATFPSPTPDDDVLVVREWVLVGVLREAVSALVGVTPTQIRVGLEEDRCTSVAVHVTATYGAVLADAASAVRSTVARAVVDTLGADALPPEGVPVEVTIDDVIV